MIIYIIQIVIIAFLGAGIHPRRNLQRKKIFLWISFLILVIVSGFRDISVGTDTSSYVNMFNNINNISFSLSRYEIGFLYYLKLIRLITDNTTIFLLVNSIICIGSTSIFVYKHSEDPCLSILLYIVLKSYFFQMTGIRQSLATAILLTAFSLLLTKLNLKNSIISGLLIALAILFHTMALVAYIPFLMWVWPKKRLINWITPSKTLKWSIILSVTSFVLYPYIMRLVLLLLPKYSLYFSGIWSDSNYSASLFKLLIQVAFLIAGVIYLQKKDKLFECDRFSLLMIMFSVIVGTLAMRMEIWGRLTGVFSVYTPLILAPSFTSVDMDSRNRMILKTSIFLFSFIYMMITFIFRPEWDGVVPYSFI